jgi:hypothetical protein
MNDTEESIVALLTARLLGSGAISVFAVDRVRAALSVAYTRGCIDAVRREIDETTRRNLAREAVQ